MVSLCKVVTRGGEQPLTSPLHQPGQGSSPSQPQGHPALEFPTFRRERSACLSLKSPGCSMTVARPRQVQGLSLTSGGTVQPVTVRSPPGAVRKRKEGMSAEDACSEAREARGRSPRLQVAMGAEQGLLRLPPQRVCVSLPSHTSQQLGCPPSRRPHPTAQSPRPCPVPEPHHSILCSAPRRILGWLPQNFFSAWTNLLQSWGWWEASLIPRVLPSGHHRPCLCKASHVQRDEAAVSLWKQGTIWRS